MKHRIYPRIVKGDANEVTRDEILWIDKEDGTVDLQKRNASGKLVSIVFKSTPPEEPVVMSIEEEVVEEPVVKKTTTTKTNILD